jgi:glycerol-3-phosphate acyltransferase PlsY
MEVLGNINIILYLTAYLTGGIPFGYLLARKFAGIDIKEYGSGNIGATNVLRVLKSKDPILAKKLGAATLLLDAIKGVVVILAGMLLGAPDTTLWSIGVLSVIGHCFSPYLNFEGGKGVATGFGVLAILLPIPSLIALVSWVVVAKGLKISSLSSLIATAILLVSSYIIYPDGLTGIGSHSPLWVIVTIIFYKHIPNIVRLIEGEEKRVA